MSQLLAWDGLDGSNYGDHVNNDRLPWSCFVQIVNSWDKLSTVRTRQLVYHWDENQSYSVDSSLQPASGVMECNRVVETLARQARQLVETWEATVPGIQVTTKA